MPATAVALQILLILLPGFTAAYLVQLLATRAKQTDLEKVIEALLFSFLNYVSYGLYFSTSWATSRAKSYSLEIERSRKNSHFS